MPVANNTPQTTPQPVQTAPGGPAGGASAPSSPAPKSAKFLTPKILAVVGVVLLIIIIGAVASIYSNRTKAPEELPPQELEVTLPVPGVSPPPLVVAEEEQQNPVREYFVRVSPENFKEAFLDNVSKLAAEAFANYQSAVDNEAKHEAAKSFFIYLNSPSADRSDPAYELMLADVKADLENSLGKPLF